MICDMNKAGAYKTIEQAIKQYYEETGVLITEINVVDYINTSTQEKRSCLIALETREYQTTVG